MRRSIRMIATGAAVSGVSAASLRGQRDLLEALDLVSRIAPRNAGTMRSGDQTMTRGASNSDIGSNNGDVYSDDSQQSDASDSTASGGSVARISETTPSEADTSSTPRTPSSSVVFNKACETDGNTKPMAITVSGSPRSGNRDLSCSRTRSESKSWSGSQLDQEPGVCSHSSLSQSRSCRQPVSHSENCLAQVNDVQQLGRNEPHHFTESSSLPCSKPQLRGWQGTLEASEEEEEEENRQTKGCA